MDGFTCDMCGKVLLADEDTRYVARIEVFAAYDPMEIAPGDMQTDRSDEMARLLERLREADPRELQDQVYKSFQFDFCPGCQKKYLADPLPSSHGDSVSES
ncbi:MAG: hypothetical protein GWP05_01700 [Anaerolineaceae bacterium]|nr:hypothetical protein [Anaerolineaceae bacterium]